MKRMVRPAVILVVLSVMALLIIACGATTKPAPVPVPTPKPTPPVAVAALPAIPTPTSRPFSLREEIFEIGEPTTAHAFGVEEVTLVTSDGQKWLVSMLSNVQVHRFGTGYERINADGFLTAKLISLGEYKNYKGADQKSAFFRPPMEFSFVVDFVNSNLPVNPAEKNRVFAHARETSVCIFCVRNWEVGRFPLADYLFELDDASYRREIRLLVLQVLDILFQGSGPAESN